MKDSGLVTEQHETRPEARQSYQGRVFLGISQRELAERIGMKQAQLSKIEQLDSIPSLKTLDRYARGLGLAATISFKPVATVD